MTATNCKSCGAARGAASSGPSFVCEFCGTSNVDDDYLQARAAQVQARSDSKSLQLGLMSVAAGDFAAAEKQLEACLAEDPRAVEGWIYLAYCKATLARPSNFKRNAQAARECLQRAGGLDVADDTVRNGAILVANKLLSSSLAASRYYLDTASKKYLAYSGSKDAKSHASEEAMLGLQLVQDALRPEANDAELRASVLVAAIVDCVSLNKEIGSTKELERQGAQFMEALVPLAASRPELLEREVRRFPDHRGLFKKLVEKKAPAPVPTAKPAAAPVAKPAPLASRRPSTADAGDEKSQGKGRKLGLAIAGGFGALLVAGWIGHALSGSGARQQVAAAPVVVVAPPVVAQPAPAPTVQLVAAQEASPAAPPAEAQPQASVQTAALAAPAPAELAVTAGAGKTVAAVRAPAESRDMLTQMLQKAGSAYQVSELKSAVEALPKPAMGDRKNARRLNELGLAAFRAENYPEAADRLRQATEADPADVEALNNYVYALVRGGRFGPAEDAAGVLLTQSPGRTSAWANLAEIYVLTGRDYEASRALLVAFHFSSNKDKTLAYLREKQLDASSPMQNAVRQALADIEKL